MGFLGVGKTTAILSLLEQKPATENWAILVNEFGQIGMDGTLFKAHGISVKEIPGGCLCCAVGLPFQVAVNRLLSEVRPDRLLIEPTGLGHPKRTIDMLTEGPFQSVIDLRASICLVDPSKLKESRYTSHESFVDQIALADVVVANKMDITSAHSIKLFNNWISQSNPTKTVSAQTTQGQLDINWLNLPRNPNRHPAFPKAHSHQSRNNVNTTGYKSFSHIFSEQSLFNYGNLSTLLSELKVERVKGIFSTDEGWFIFNAVDGNTTINSSLPSTTSKVEIIDSKPIQTALLDLFKRCLIKRPSSAL